MVIQKYLFIYKQYVVRIRKKKKKKLVSFLSKNLKQLLTPKSLDHRLLHQIKLLIRVAILSINTIYIMLSHKLFI